MSGTEIILLAVGVLAGYYAVSHFAATGSPV